MPAAQAAGSLSSALIASACNSFLLLNATFKPRHRFSARRLLFFSALSSKSTAVMSVVSALNLMGTWRQGREEGGSAGSGEMGGGGQTQKW